MDTWSCMASQGTIFCRPLSTTLQKVTQYPEVWSISTFIQAARYRLFIQHFVAARRRKKLFEQLISFMERQRIMATRLGDGHHDSRVCGHEDAIVYNIIFGKPFHVPSFLCDQEIVFFLHGEKAMKNLRPSMGWSWGWTWRLQWKVTQTWCVLDLFSPSWKGRTWFVSFREIERLIQETPWTLMKRHL